MRKDRSGGRRAIAGVAGAVGIAALIAVVLLAVSAGGSNGGYAVRAIFDDAGNIIPGETVDIASVKVGTVKSVEPTPTAKAAVVLSISNPGFQDFRSDASCTIRLQGLIGEKYVDCEPTQPRPEGTPLPPPLKKIPSGHEGAGQYYLPVTNTHSPVGSDLLNDIQRLPERQRFTIIINELGAGLMNRGSDLSAVIRRANPALQELDKVLSILAGENKTLEELAVNSDKALKPFAAVRQHVAKFIAESNKTAIAGANTRAALARNLELFPKFLEELVPAVERLGKFAEATQGTMQYLGEAAPGIDKTFTSIPGFSASSEKFFKNLGGRAKESGPALVATKPLLARLKKLGAAGLPAATNLESLFGGFRNTGGLERLLDFIFLGTGSANGYDALGHFLRTEGLANACLTYRQDQPFTGCNHHLFSTGSGSSPTTAAAARASGSSGIDAATDGVVMARTLAVIKGDTPEQAIAEYPGEGEAEAKSSSSGGSSSGAGGTAAPKSAASKAAASGWTTLKGAVGASEKEAQAGKLLLNYLLGGE
ncbi:MAG TPA: MlaD family protein [Solirubrobacteraceae bacterium]|nr:MlaD family protein [Solirubrobacteraceae bacterium]